MKVHVLPGDALAENFKNFAIEGEMIVCRECLVEGDVKAATLDEFWQARARFIGASYDGNEEQYFQTVVGEFEKLKSFAATGAEINLWFEYELFCQVNMWFCLYLLRGSEAPQVYRVAPVVRDETNVWNGFGDLAAEDLEKCFAERVELSGKDISLGADLWIAFQNDDFEALENLSANESKSFPRLKEVCRAAIEKNSRPKKVLLEIIENGARDFAEIFPEFSKKAGVYGFGDTQVQRILAEI